MEPLECALRARLGREPSCRRLIAVIEPLEVSLRARLGRELSCRRLIAVMEPLEVSLRARWRQELASWEEVGTECQFWKTIVRGRRTKWRILINLQSGWSRIRYRSLIWKHPRLSKNKISRKISEKNKNPEMVMDANYHFGGFCTEICEVSCPEGKN